MRFRHRCESQANTLYSLLPFHLIRHIDADCARLFYVLLFLFFLTSFTLPSYSQSTFWKPRHRIPSFLLFLLQSLLSATCTPSAIYDFLYLTLRSYTVISFISSLSSLLCHLFSAISSLSSLLFHLFSAISSLSSLLFSFYFPHLFFITFFFSLSSIISPHHYLIIYPDIVLSSGDSTNHFMNHGTPLKLAECGLKVS